MNYKRGKSRKNVRCRGCTDSRDYIGSDRLQRKKEAFLPDTQRVSNGRFYKWCPDCKGTGVCGCNQCEQEKVGCLACLGYKITDFHTP